MQPTRVAIVGLGGTGSLIAEQLAHLGVTDFLLIDSDTG
jgi:molybdopterin-synthase adenylyltransferase